MTSRLAEWLRPGLLMLALLRAMLLPLLLSRLGWPVPLRAVARRVRSLLDRGGLIYRKLGQYLAMRTDLLPPEFCEELDLLFESATPMPAQQVVSLIEAELGRPLSACFTHFDPEPVGSASVAQVHRATALDGQELALKVQRAGIQQRFATDVRLFRRAAALLDLLHVAGSLSLRQLFDEFAEFTRHELDFELEGRTADGLRREMSPHGVVPRIRWDLTTPRLLAMDFVEGESFLTICRLSETGRRAEVQQVIGALDFHRIVAQLADECFRQLFVSGLFHGDPHPGNVILRRDGRFAFLDCGIAGALTPGHRRDLAGFVESLALGRFHESAMHYTRMCEVTAETDLDAWTADVTRALARWQAGLRDPHSPIEERHMGRLQGNIAIAMRKHHVRTLPNQLLVWRALVLLDTTTLRLPIRFDVLRAMRSFFKRLRGDPGVLLRGVVQGAWRDAPLLVRRALCWSRRQGAARGGGATVTAQRQRVAASSSRASSAFAALTALAALALGTLAAAVPAGLAQSLLLAAALVAAALTAR